MLSERSRAKSSPVDVLAVATATAGELLAEIGRRWPGQARGWVLDGDLVASWGRGLAETGAEAGKMRAALARLTARPYPPDLGALLAEVKDFGQVTEMEAQRSMLCVLRALSSGDLSECSRQELWTLKNYPGGSWALRTEPASDSQRKRWRELLTEAGRVAVDSLPPAVEKPAGLLARRLTEEERQRGSEAMARIKAMLAQSDETK